MDHGEMKICVDLTLKNEIDPPIDILKAIIEEASDVYANMINPEDEPFLSDYEYDEIVKIVKIHDSSYREHIGSSVRGGKIKLPFILGSLDQAYDNETLEWVIKNKLEDSLFVISDKQDGTSGASIHTKKNGLNISYSRGNGYEGADITRHIKKITNYPNAKSDIKIRFEVIVPYQDFIAAKEEHTRLDRKFYKNPRNYTAGQMNSETADDEFFRLVKVIGTSLIDSDLDKKAQYDLMEKLGFEVTPHTVVKGSELTEEFLTEYLKERKKASPTEIDGIVIDINSAKIRNEMDWDSENPPYSKKYKIVMEDDKRETTVTNVIYEASKDGYLKPRIEISPVDINGVTITYCTGFNAGFIYDNKINIGSKIIITRQGDVIPHCASVVTQSDEPLLPSEEEHGTMLWTDTHVDLYLRDRRSNKQVLINEILHSSNTLNIPSLKEGSIKKLVEAGYTSFSDIAFALKEELQEVVGESAGEKIYNGIIEKLKDVPAARLADASQTLGRGVGERTCKKIFEKIGYYNFIDKNFTREDLINCEDVGEKTADLIMQNIDAFISYMNLMDGICNIALPKQGNLTGLSFCLTGIRDNMLQESIEAKGGEIIKSVSKKKDMYLICKDVNEKSSKLEKAREVLDSDRIIDINDARRRWL